MTNQVHRKGVTTEELSFYLNIYFTSDEPVNIPVMNK